MNGKIQGIYYPSYGNASYGSSGNYEFMMREQIQANKKMQALNYSYETLGNLLSSAENFAGLPNEQYKAYNVTTSYKYEDLKSEFAWELHCFQLAIKKFQRKFQCPYEFPPKLPKEKIIKDIYRYMKQVSNKKDQFLYEIMLSLIIGEEININFDALFEELDKNANSKINPDKLRKIIGPLNAILDKKLEEADKGNMNIEFEDDKLNKNREYLKELSKHDKSIKVKIGIEGELKFIKDGFFFCPKLSNSTKKIKIIEPKFDNYNNLDSSLYLYNNNNHECFIYVTKKKDKNCYQAIDFCEKEKDFNKNAFNDIAYYDNIDKADIRYTIGTIQLNQNDKFYGLIKGLIEEDYK